MVVSRAIFSEVYTQVSLVDKVAECIVWYLLFLAHSHFPKEKEGWCIQSWTTFSLITLKVTRRRFIVATLCDLLLLYTAARKMGSEFVLGYIQAMDGEKDPRNLIIALNSVHRIVLHLPFGDSYIEISIPVTSVTLLLCRCVS